MKKCCTCKQELPKTLFYKDKNRNDGLSPQCKSCHKKYWQSDDGKKAKSRGQRKYSQTESGKLVHALQVKRQRKLHPDKSRARGTVNNAVRARKLVKESCLHCGSIKDLQFHHHKGYSPENALNVVCLCRSCHRKEDKAKKHDERNKVLLQSSKSF